MKLKITIILFLSFCFLSAQSQIKFISSDKNDMRILADSIVSNAKRNYVFKSETNKGRYQYSLNYINIEDNNDQLSVDINIRWVGESRDLEIEGTPEFRFDYVRGRYLDLFPFWKKFINNEDNLEELAKKKATYILKNNQRYVFSSGNDFWTLSMKDILK
ncbi:hypothetical protein [Dysgonomonas sp. ZJ709]|uniref:hypothetical protein n=1 Tax=Dysgonomonas sp. ZJ709 TaxID=2709797 RepID=UPI0013EB56EB|nr:hypothetical protein [Dysgonomonas sp. ZJ709]